MRDSLVNIVGQVRVVPIRLLPSREIASGNLDLSSRTEQQANQSWKGKTTASMKGG